MTKEEYLGQNSLRLLYYRYKDSAYAYVLVIAVVIVLCFVLFFQVILPQVADWFSIRNEIIATRERIATINHNTQFMTTLDTTLLNKQVDTATAALPFQKDVGAMLAAITDASLHAGVALDDFSFQVGNVASLSGQVSSVSRDVSTVKVTVSVVGSIDGVNIFLHEMNQKLPLSEVTSVEADAGTTTITFNFFQKQFPQIVFTDDVPFVPLPAKREALLNDLSAWKPAAVEQAASSVGTGSAIPLF